MAEDALVADVAVAALPEMLIPHVPEAFDCTYPVKLEMLDFL